MKYVCSPFSFTRYVSEIHRVMGAAAPTAQKTIFQMSKNFKNKSGHTSTYFMLAQKNPQWKDIFCDLYKKDKSGLLQKAFVRNMFLFFLHRSQKMSFHSEIFCANTKNVDAYPKFFSEFFDT